MSAPRLGHLELVHGPVARPGYDPKRHGIGIVHLGIGAFHRAHQAVMTDAALAEDGGDWRIVGVSLRSTDVAEALNPQNGLYTLIERGQEGASARLIASVAKVIAADPAATLAALCDPAVGIVTLTVTEKGYGIDRQTRAPDPAHPAVAADFANPDAPSGVLGLLVAAIARRRDNGLSPFTVVSCDNLPENGALLRDGVIGFAKRIDRAFADWIADNIAFPSSMVDRITPASTAETLAEAERLTGCIDLAAVESEPFIQWVIEDHFPGGRPRWEAGGALFVADVAPYERMKLTMLNGSHSMLAYGGFLSGHRYVRDVMNDPDLNALVARHLQAAGAVLPALPGIVVGDYAAALVQRFRNPAIAHETFQIAMDGTQKLPQRIFQPAIASLHAGLDIRPFAFTTAMWMRYCLGETDEREGYALRDPRENEIRIALANVPKSAAAISDALHRLQGFVPDDLAAAPVWRCAVQDVLSAALSDGVASAVTREAALT